MSTLNMENPGGLKIFVVEDEALVLMLLEDYLAELGCTVVGTASRLDEALIKVHSIPADAALLDVNLAGKLSYPVAQILLSRGIPFIFATGYGTRAVPEGLESHLVLAKPFDLAQLSAALCHLTSRERASR